LSVWRRRVHANIPQHPRSFPPLPSPSHALPPSPTDAVCCLRGRERSKKIIFFIFYFFIFLVVVAGLKREKKKFRFSVFNPQDPPDPRAPQAKPREEEGFFGLVPLVTYPSSIPLLGGLTPKFLSLSLHFL
jgi:hypothetical protein